MTDGRFFWSRSCCPALAADEYRLFAYSMPVYDLLKAFLVQPDPPWLLLAHVIFASHHHKAPRKLDSERKNELDGRAAELRG